MKNISPATVRFFCITSILFIFNSFHPLFAQTGVLISGSAGTADPSAMLEIRESSKGLLLPRVTLGSLTDASSPVSSPATGLLVYNTAGAQPVGLYYWNGTSWVRLTTGGFSGTGIPNYAARWITSTDLQTGVIYDNGTNVGIGTITPSQKLDVNGSIAIAKGATIAPASFGHTSGNDNTVYFGQNGGSFGGIGIVNYYDGSFNNQYITFITHHGGVSVGERMRIDRDGNVSVNTLAGSGLRDLYVNDQGVLVTGGVVASGGNSVVDIAGYRVHYFTGSGTFTVTTGGNVEVLMVGGGGAGGGRHGGGGGGGGVLYMPVVAVTSGGSYPIVVGAGAPLNTGGTNSKGQNGGNTTAFSETALGGGGGGTYNLTPGVAGGSGGGAGHSGNGDGGGAATQGNPVTRAGTGYGSAGGSNRTGGNEAAGGGGAGGPGFQPVGDQWGGNGGPGVMINIDGYNRYWGGGGGGGGWTQNAGAGGIGGGGGGAGAGGGLGGAGGGAAINSGGAGATASGNNANGGNGGANTGGGGGGSGQRDHASYTIGNGGAGGSGIVIIRYPR